MQFLAQRIRWIIETGRVQSARAWGDAAGLSEQFIDSFQRRAKHGEADMTLGAAIALARVANTDLMWFCTGIGTPDGQLTGDADRDALADMLEQSGAAAADVAMLRKQPADRAKGLEGWRRRYEELKAFREKHGYEPSSGIDSSGTRPRRAL